MHSFAEYVSLAKQAPKKVSFSTYGLGSVPQLSFEMMAAQAGIELLHVPYKGGAESYRAAVAGDVDSVAGTSFTDLLKAGRLRPIAIGASKRSPEFPQVPTFAELGYGDQIFGPVFYGMAAPAGTPREIVNRLTAELKALAQMPDIAQRLRTVGTEPFSTGPEELVNMVRTHSDRYAPLIRKLGLNTQ